MLAMQRMLEKLVGESRALERVIAGEDLSMEDGMELMKYDDLYTIGAVADSLRQKFVGNRVTFTASEYLNYLQGPSSNELYWSWCR